MKFLILLQVLLITLKFCKPEDEPPTTIIISDSRTEMTIENLSNQSKSINEHFESLKESENDKNDLDFNYDGDFLKTDIKISEKKEQELQEVLLKAMKNNEIRKQIGEVLPILRVMSPAQRLTLAALVSSQIMTQNTLSEDNLTEMAAMVAGKNIESLDEKHNVTELLLLPISMDIAKMFKGLGKEMARNLRQEFYTPRGHIPNKNKFIRLIRKPDYKRPSSVNRRMDDSDYEIFEEETSSNIPVAEALKQPGKDECDFFTKNLCLEVSNYPTEAIISSLRENQDIANAFLTDFEVPLKEKYPHGARTVTNGPNRIERRQDGQNEIKNFVSENNYMCPSSVKYARPKRARTTSGHWKYVVNAGDYTQTLRLEICQKPKSPCSYVTNQFNSECAQVYNYHRLLTWDGNKGLHMDVFKVPSCCSCHVQGYSNFYPPDKDFTFAEKRRESSEKPDQMSELSEYSHNNAGNKREIPKLTSVEPPPITIRNRPQSVLIKEEYPLNPVDHLIPPGPPLPLENESVFNTAHKFKYNQKKSTMEQNQEYPAQSDYKRAPSKEAERNDFKEPPKELNFFPKTRLKTSERHYFNTVHSPASVATIAPHQEIIESNNPIYFQKNPINLQSFPALDIQKDNLHSNRLFMTSKPLKNSPLQLNPKINLKQPPYFRPEFQDSVSLPSKITSVYVTPTKIENRISTTASPSQQSKLVNISGHKKVNYNYHPIIDFFLSDFRKKQQTFSAPLASQEWIPVLGH